MRSLNTTLISLDSKSDAEEGSGSAAICPFCDIAKNDTAMRIQHSNDLAYVMNDGYPVTTGHALIIPKRHVASFFDITNEERHALLDLVDRAKVTIDCEHHPAAYNIGINDGTQAGQTVPHLHIHLIPRYEGQVADPRGGVRWVVPDKAAYWNKD